MTEPVARVRCYFSRGSITENEEVLSRAVLVITAPTGEMYRFPGNAQTRVSPWEPINDREDMEWFQEHSPFEVRGV